jgi:hypothetical protein
MILFMNSVYLLYIYYMQYFLITILINMKHISSITNTITPMF